MWPRCRRSDGDKRLASRILSNFGHDQTTKSVSIKNHSKDIQRHSKTFKSLKRSLPSKSFWHILFISNRNHIWGTWILEGPKTIVHLRAETWGSLFFRHRATSSLEFAWCQMPQAGNRFRIYAVASYSVFTSNDVCYSWIQLGNMGLPSSLRIRVPRNPIVNHHFPRICPSPSIFGRSHIFI